MTRLRGEDGFTLVEVLIVSVLMLVVLGATLTTFNTFQRTSARQREPERGAGPGPPTRWT